MSCSGFLFSSTPVKLTPSKPAPYLITVCVILLVVLVRLLDLDLFDRLERMAYDMRVRAALKFPQPSTTNLGFVYIDEESIDQVRTNAVGFRFGLYWPRQVYGRLIQELSLQGAKAVAFDVVFGELREDHAPVQMADGGFMESDEFFARQMRQAENVILATTSDLGLPDLFVTNAAAVGDITTEKDPDGILRRAKAFRIRRHWHSAFRQVAADPDYGIDLGRARVEPGRIVLLQANGEEIEIPVDENNHFELADFGTPPPEVPPTALAFTEERIWHMGIVLAAQEMGLDLENAEIALDQGRITLRAPNGLKRVIPVDSQGYFYVNWRLPPNATMLAREPIHSLLAQYKRRIDGGTSEFRDNWRNKLVVVGSNVRGGNDLTDRGATPLEKDTLLVSKHWNVANSIITGHFVHRTSLATDCALIALLSVVTAVLTWRLRVFSAAGGIILLALAYCGAGLILYVQNGYWLPLVLPIFGAVLVEHGLLVTYRVVFEQREKRRLRSVFYKMVSPHVAKEVLEMDTLALGGSRCEITVFFADVRGFTELTDATHARAARIVAERGLSGAAADAVYDEQARDMLETVNCYLSLVADVVTRHDGTLDKYIGDCVMAYWGAPTPKAQHALHCVRAAIDAQRAIHELNRKRGEENKRRERENEERAQMGIASLPMLPMLSLGSGVNSGVAIAGLMGSEEHELSYTVFGREVNLASRLEAVSGRGRIVIGEATYHELRRDDPALAATCIELPPATVKGFRAAIKNYEVPWLPATDSQAAAQTSPSSTPPEE